MPAPPTGPITISAEELCKQIARDPVAAAKSFHEREATVDGYVYYLGEGSKGIFPVIKLQGDENLAIDIGFLQPGAKVRYGQRVKFTGTLVFVPNQTPCPMLHQPKFVSAEAYVKPDKPLEFFAVYTSDALLKDAARGKDAMVKKLFLKPGLGEGLPFLKSLIVEGTVAKISPPSSDSFFYQLTLATTDGSGQIECTMEDESASALKEGQKVTVVGVYDLPPVPDAPVTMRQCMVY